MKQATKPRTGKTKEHKTKNLIIHPIDNDGIDAYKRHLPQSCTEAHFDQRPHYRLPPKKMTKWFKATQKQLNAITKDLCRCFAPNDCIMVKDITDLLRKVSKALE